MFNWLLKSMHRNLKNNFKSTFFIVKSWPVWRLLSSPYPWFMLKYIDEYDKFLALALVIHQGEYWVKFTRIQRSPSRNNPISDQNNCYEITINGFQVRKINEIINVMFGLHYGKPSSALRPRLGCSPSWVLDIQRLFGKTLLE